MWSIIVLSLLFLHYGGTDLVVQLKKGKVRGTTLDTPSGKKFYAWRGIPYAKPPLEKLRYLAPQISEPWKGVLDASRDSPACMSFEEVWIYPKPINGYSEDCLYINVYTPIKVGSYKRINATLPVMFWIFGGGLSTGSAEFAYTDPTPLLEENVIVVTANYRLGTFGFLSTGDDLMPGNAGLKDQVLALQWTRENIGCFGGNPLDITIFGESAGGGSVGYHIISPLSKNLFKAGIIESGSPLFNGLEKDPKEYAYNLAIQVNPFLTKANTTEEVRNVLQAADANLIVNLTYGKSPGPVLEAKSNFSFLSEPLYETLESGNFARVPIIIGYNSEESISYVTDINNARTQASAYDENPELLVSRIKLKDNATAKAVAEKIRQEYVGKNKTFAENVAGWLNWLSDEIFLRNIHKQATLQLKYVPVYMYQFSYYGTMSKNHSIIPGAGKVGHGDEVGYLFNTSIQLIKTDKDYLARKRFVKLWTNFAKTLNPTPNDNSAELLQNVKWKPITQSNHHYLDIDNDLQMKPDRKLNKTIFWDYIWCTYSYRPYNTF